VTNMLVTYTIHGIRFLVKYENVLYFSHGLPYDHEGPLNILSESYLLRFR
jgi:hypothetical protein